ncbi:MAG TPA: hypothetical protein EYH30_05090 [Anaerolineales bacterium]|nr:hypothetical protein [Anaerolineae bacterium]HIQ01487.1 hypothetical protein [Anaerolineales bacterium]
MKRHARRTVVGVALSTLAILIAWAYSYTSPMTPRASREWSKGRVIGRTPVSRPVALHSAPDQGVLLVWPNLEGQLELAHIGEDGELLLDRVLSVSVEEPRDPQLQIGPDGRLHLLWREMAEPNAVIRYALLEADGTLVGRPQLISDPALWAEAGPRLVLDAEARPHALWADRTGIQWAVLSRDGRLLEGPTLLIPEGRFPAVQADREGRLHLAWQYWAGRNTRQIYYALLDPRTGELGPPQEVAQVFQRSGQRIEGPVLGLDPQTGYVLWSVLDMRAISSRGRYAFFPLNLPRQKRILALHLKEGWDPGGMYALAGQRTPLLVALSETVSSMQGEEVQVAVVALARGQTPEYEVWGLARGTSGGRQACLNPAQVAGTAEASERREPPAQEWEAEHIVTASNLPSVKPILAADDRSYLHLAWLEPGGFGQYRVVYASTAPEVKRTYNALSLWDIVDPLFRSVFRLSLALPAVVPILVRWALVPMGGIVLYHFFTGEEWLERTRSWVVLGAAVSLEVALTFLLPPRTSVPWPPIRWVAPVVTTGLAGLGTALFLRRQTDRSLFGAFFLFTGIHTLLQLAVYFVPWGLGGGL